MGLTGRVGRMLGRPSGPGARGGDRGGSRARPGKAQGPRLPLIERGRFGVSVMAILKDEAPNMAEWLCHHMAIGVDHFFLYDNGSTDDLHEVLKPYADHGIVTTVYFPMRGLQRDANNHVVRFFGATTEWLAYVDIDEFLVPEHDEPIGGILARYGDAEQVLVSRKEFCYGGHRTPPGGLVTEAYREVSVDVPRVGTSAILAKPIIRPAGVARVGIHNATTVHGRTVNTAGQPTSEEATVIEDPTLRQPPDEPLLHQVVAGVPGQAHAGHDVHPQLPAARRALRHPGPGGPCHRPLAAAHEGAHGGDGGAAPQPVALRQPPAPGRFPHQRHVRPGSHRGRQQRGGGRERGQQEASGALPADAGRAWGHGACGGSTTTRPRRAPSSPRRTWPRRWPGCRPR